jgi:hypothetical protein
MVGFAINQSEIVLMSELIHIKPKKKPAELIIQLE